MAKKLDDKFHDSKGGAAPQRQDQSLAQSLEAPMFICLRTILIVIDANAIKSTKHYQAKIHSRFGPLLLICRDSANQEQKQLSLLNGYLNYIQFRSSAMNKQFARTSHSFKQNSSGYNDQTLKSQLFLSTGSNYFKNPQPRRNLQPYDFVDEDFPTSSIHLPSKTLAPNATSILFARSFGEEQKVGLLKQMSLIAFMSKQLSSKKRQIYFKEKGVNQLKQQIQQKKKITRLHKETYGYKKQKICRQKVMAEQQWKKDYISVSKQLKEMDRKVFDLKLKNSLSKKKHKSIKTSRNAIQSIDRIRRRQCHFDYYPYRYQPGHYPPNYYQGRYYNPHQYQSNYNQHNHYFGQNVPSQAQVHRQLPQNYINHQEVQHSNQAAHRFDQFSLGWPIQHINSRALQPAHSTTFRRTAKKDVSHIDNHYQNLQTHSKVKRSQGQGQRQTQKYKNEGHYGNMRINLNDSQTIEQQSQIELNWDYLQDKSFEKGGDKWIIGNGRNSSQKNQELVEKFVPASPTAQITIKNRQGLVLPQKSKLAYNSKENPNFYNSPAAKTNRQQPYSLNIQNFEENDCFLGNSRINFALNQSSISSHNSIQNSRISGNIQVPITQMPLSKIEEGQSELTRQNTDAIHSNEIRAFSSKKVKSSDRTQEKSRQSGSSLSSRGQPVPAFPPSTIKQESNLYDQSRDSQLGQIFLPSESRRSAESNSAGRRTSQKQELYNLSYARQRMSNQAKEGDDIFGIQLVAQSRISRESKIRGRQSQSKDSSMHDRFQRNQQSQQMYALSQSNLQSVIR